MTGFQKKLWIGIGVMAVLSPLGLILPDMFKAGDAWGEWGTDSIKAMLGYVPQGLVRLSELWKAPLPDYGFGGENAASAFQYLAYIVSGLVGIALAWLAVVLIKRFFLNDLKNNRGK